MNFTNTKSFQVSYAIALLGIFGAVALFGFAAPTHAQEDYYGAVDYGSYDGSQNYGDYSGADLGYFGASDNLGYYGATDYGSYDGSQNLGYYGASDNLGYYGASDGNLGYYGASDNLGYYGASDNLGYYGATDNGYNYGTTGYDYGYTGYDYGYSASPVYSYGTPTYSTGGGYSVAPHTYVTPHYYASPTPSYSYTTPTYTTPQPHITITPTTIGTPSGQQQQQTQTQNQAPITNTNINTINIPAPVYQAPVQQTVQYVAPTYTTPTCSITASPTYYNSYNNQPVTLQWTSNNAYSAAISPNVGTVNTNGMTTVYPTTGTTIYTMTVYGQGGTGTCQTQVVYQAQPYYQPTYYQPAPVVHTNPAPYVSLNQIPYTGFDFGPVGNALYWLGLMAFAAAAAYLVVYSKGGMAILATNGQRRTRVAHAHAATAPKHGVDMSAFATLAPATAHTEPTATLPTREHRHATADAMKMKLVEAKAADEMPRIIITRG